jgi:hypothetical protein
MSTIVANNQLTLLELAKRKDPDGSITNIIEVLTLENSMFIDAPWIEANGQMQHNTTRRASLPTGTFRGFNQGVPRSSSQTIKIVENLAMLEDFSVVDKALADMNTDPAKFRNGEDIAHVEGLGQNWASKMIYGNGVANPEQFTGFAPRMNTLTAKRVLGAGGSGSDTTSVYAIQWGENTCHMVYPIGHPNFGVESEDMGVDIVLDTESNEYRAYRTHFMIYGGLVVRDDRAIKRIANIETTGTTNTFNDDQLLALTNEFRHGGRGVVLYVNRTVKTQMDILAKDKNNVNYTTGNVFGEPTTMFRGFPVRINEAIVDTETAIS